jgi:hypothetical protein
MGPVCLCPPREPGCLALRYIDRSQLAGIVTSAVLASVAMVIRYRSPSTLWAIDRVLVLTGLGFVITSLNVAVGAFRTEFRDEFRRWRHLLVPAPAAVLFLFLRAGSSIRVRSRHVPQAKEEKGGTNEGYC